eukprot:m.293689 g.293689  ORF g.293689 m.293689 type:complete len:132 (-) comp12849_c0_seq1:189-584(-)
MASVAIACAAVGVVYGTRVVVKTIVRRRARKRARRRARQQAAAAVPAPYSTVTALSSTLDPRYERIAPRPPHYDVAISEPGDEPSMRLDLVAACELNCDILLDKLPPLPKYDDLMREGPPPPYDAPVGTVV